MRFTKVHCGANDFIIIDARKKNILPSKALVQRLTDRRTGIGADGVVLIERAGLKQSKAESRPQADFRLRYFNPDGSEYAVCGNGSLCALLYEARRIGALHYKAIFSGLAGVLRGELRDNVARVKLPFPREVKLDLRVSGLECSFVDICVPHCIIFVDDVDSIDIMKAAPPIRYHSELGSAGANVNFVQVINEHKIAVRSYERGVEAETLSCGSGSCSACVVGWLKGLLKSPIEVKTRSGNLVVNINNLDDIWLEGTPEIVYTGELKNI